MSAALYYDRAGRPMDREAWTAAMEDFTYRRVASETLASGYHVSTVWMGLDHNLGAGQPLIFETMVFPPVPDSATHRLGDVDMDRYSTEAEALAGHEAMVQKWIAR